MIELFARRQLLRLQPMTASASTLFFGRRDADRRSNRTSTSSIRMRIRIRELSYSRMLDMGGAPSANSDQSLIRTPNASKNSKLQAVAFDFKVLINVNENGSKNKNKSSSDANAAQQMATANSSTTNKVSTNQESLADLDRIQQVAALLNVDLDTTTSTTASNNGNGGGGTSTSTTQTQPESPITTPPPLKNHNPSDRDVRAKYASRLKGGIAGIELAKSEVDDNLKKGDAAGHLAARKIAMLDDNTSTTCNDAKTGAKWLPSLEASQLLTLLTNRSIRIVLLPTLRTTGRTPTKEEDENEPRMEVLKAQLKNVVIDNIIPKFDNHDNVNDNDSIENALRAGILDELDIDPNNVLLVSDRDPYLRVARDMGMSICRLQQKNARRGNITPHYTVETVGEVQDVVNEINGISFNAVLNR